MKNSNLDNLYTAGKVLFFITSAILFIEQIKQLNLKEDKTTERLRNAGFV